MIKEVAIALHENTPFNYALASKYFSWGSGKGYSLGG